MNNIINQELLIMIFHPEVSTFREVIRRGSFIAAAEALSVSGAAVSKQIKSFEQKLGVVLFNRTTRLVQPTEAAIRLEAVLSQNEQQFSLLLDELSLSRQKPTGRLRINVPMSFGEFFLRKPIAEYARRYPDVVVDVDFEDKRVHLIEDGYDMVVRIGVLEDSGLIARKVGECPLYLCASPEFLATHGVPADVSALSRMPAIIYANAEGAPAWTHADNQGQVSNVPLQPHFYANSAGMMREACMAGIGLAILPAFSCQEDLDDGTLIRVLPQYETAPLRGIYAVYPDRRFLPLKVGAFIELLEESLN